MTEQKNRRISVTIDHTNSKRFDDIEGRINDVEKQIHDLNTSNKCLLGLIKDINVSISHLFDSLEHITINDGRERKYRTLPIKSLTTYYSDDLSSSGSE